MLQLSADEALGVPALVLGVPALLVGEEMLPFSMPLPVSPLLISEALASAGCFAAPRESTRRQPMVVVAHCSDAGAPRWSLAGCAGHFKLRGGCFDFAGL